MSGKKIAIAGSLLILLFPIIFYLVLYTSRPNISFPPVYGPKATQTIAEDGKERVDTIYHTIPDFSFTSQFGETVTQENLRGKIYIADYFFTTCQTICPKMTGNMHSMQLKFLDDTLVNLISHTVNPEYDSVQVLLDYATKVGAKPGKWYFVTGDKKELYDLARAGYLIPVQDGDGGPDDFIHSDQLVLVDQRGRIRGFYNGTDGSELKRMREDIKALKAEPFIPFKSGNG